MNLEALNKISQDAWNQNAEFWDEKMGEGNQFQRASDACPQSHPEGDWSLYIFSYASLF
jgi:hypothetical protein